MKQNKLIQGRVLPWTQSLMLLLLTCIPPAAQAQAPDAAAGPSCSADATKGALDQILRKKMRDFIDTYAVTKDVDGLLAQSTLEFAAIRTQDRDAATGAVTCAANFTSVIAPIKTSHAFPDGVTKNGAVEYKVERTDDGQLYVTVLQADRPY
jgi:hypothetical protein